MALLRPYSGKNYAKYFFVLPSVMYKITSFADRLCPEQKWQKIGPVRQTSDLKWPRLA